MIGRIKVALLRNPYVLSSLRFDIFHIFHHSHFFGLKSVVETK